MRVDRSRAIETYQRISSMKRINGASDDAAGLAISEKLKANTSGVEQGTENTRDMKNLARTAEGTLDSIHDNLQRMRDLSLRASNGIMTVSDKEIIQGEITEIKDSIAEQVKNTEFNEQRLIDGSFKDKNVASNASGSGMKMRIENTGLEELGIKDFDVREDFNIEDIDNAIEKVSQSRGNLGATSNRFDSVISSNQTAAYNQQVAESRISDADIAKELHQKKINDVLEQYQYFSENQKVAQQGQIFNIIG